MYWNVVDLAAGEFTQVLFEDVASHPMLPCTKSVHCAAVFFQAIARGEKSMTLFVVCCNATPLRCSSWGGTEAPRRKGMGARGRRSEVPP
ncbi:unnamed protein product [Urochloa humidicola]